MRSPIPLILTPSFVAFHRSVGSPVVLALLLTMLSPSVVRAETIEFPEEELATESVLPVFDNKVVVRERTVQTEGRFELGGGAGLNLVEPLYGQMVFNFAATYHIDEIHGVNATGYFLDTGLSSAGEDLQSGKGLEGSNFDASLAPTVENMFFMNYQFTAYYGKLSMTKQSVVNLSLYGLLGVGMVNWSDAGVLGLNAGFGQKIYFNPNLALRVDLAMAIYQGPDPTSPKTTGQLLQAGDDPLGSDDFDSTVYFRPFLTASLVYLF
jgi:outer membrane beta-barrel protein